ncbi:MAG: D-alanine aminotransferase [Deltaproteobacteria bacterium ADurb.Bin510]|nr:MAG: D-alanine aminotransferase [Deltaproteobacteria bacterium ADurb.Bin510]
MRHTKDEIRAAVLETLDANPHLNEAAIRIMLTGGVSQDGTLPEGCGQLIVSVMPKPELPTAWYVEGVKVITVPYERFLPGAKSTNYLSAVKAQQQAKAQGAIEAIYVDRGGNLLEGTTTNFFGIRHGRIVTPGADLLPGVTRRVLFELFEGEIDIAPLNYADITCLEEAFISASNKEIVPVTAIDDIVIGSGRVGERVSSIMQRFRAYTEAFGQGRAAEL